MPSYSQYKRQMATMDADDANIETWITVKGNHIPIMKGQSKEEAVQSFLEKKGKSSGGAKTVMKPDVEKPRSTTVVSKGSGKAKYKVGDVTKQGKIKEVIPARLSDTPYYKLENGKTYLEEELHAEKPAFRELKGTKHQGGTIGLSKEEHNRIEEYNKWARKETRRVKSGEAAREANARPILKADENADVSDIVKQYKADMKALGENASPSKQNKVEVNAIKEFMRRKVGAGHPYEDYYNYWLRGMSKNDSDAFNSIYGESENREKAFEALSNEKAKPVDQKKWDKAYEDAKKTYGPKTLKNRWPSVEEVQAQYKANEKPANKGWQNARSGHPETIGKVVRRVVKKMGEARKPKSVAEKLGINWEEFEDLERGSSMSQEITQMASRKPKK